MSLREAAEQAMMATPHKQLIDELLDSRIPKSEREHAAAREIERLRQALVKPEQEPVAYVTGFSKGYAVVQPVDRSLLMPVGMALYRSPPTIDEMETVEPVAWMHEFEGVATLNMTPPNYYGDHWKHTALYAAPPKREPMTEQQLDEMFDQAEIAIYIADRQQKEHLEVYSFGVRDAEKWHGIGGEE